MKFLFGMLLLSQFIDVFFVGQPLPFLNAHGSCYIRNVADVIMHGRKYFPRLPNMSWHAQHVHAQIRSPFAVVARFALAVVARFALIVSSKLVERCVV